VQLKELNEQFECLVISDPKKTNKDT